jgi:hypothetical protein
LFWRINCLEIGLDLILAMEDETLNGPPLNSVEGLNDHFGNLIASRLSPKYASMHLGLDRLRGQPAEHHLEAHENVSPTQVAHHNL